VLTAVTGVALAAVPASAAPVYQITAAWAPGTPTTVKSGDVVTGVWRVNVNDSQPAPGNGPVDNVNFTVTLQNGVFGALPDPCLTTGVTPPSSISSDGKTLICNVGTKNQGTSVAVQAPVQAVGPTNSQLSASGSIAGQTAALPPIDIVNPFGMDIRWGVGTAKYTLGSGYYTMDLEWTLSKNTGSDPGPQTVTYNLTMASPQGGAVQIDPQGCTPFSNNAADGHPWSGGSHPANQLDSFPTTCTITATGANTFLLTLSGINYNPANPPTLDSAGNRLPTDQVALASGSIWIRVITSAAGSVQLTSDAPTYTSTTGQTAQDNPSNNTESKAWTTPGLYSSGWGRGYTGNGGTTWDNTYKVAAGTTVGQYMDTALQLHGELPDTFPVGMCSKIDTRYANFVRFDWNGAPAGGVNGAVVEYYTGADPTLDPASAGYDPQGFNCGVVGGWSTTAPADPTQVKAVRVTMTEAQARVYSQDRITPDVWQTIKPGTPAGTDVWSFMSAQVAGDGSWYNRSDVCVTPIPGARYPCTTGFSDVLHVVTASPSIQKSVDRTVVTPGVPATFTLTYAANGAGSIPPSVDGFQIVDTLPAHMSYVPGSATPAPTVTTNGSGQQVLTWTIDGVTTNVDHPLTYQAVADSSATPGETLVNSTTASFGGVTTAPATAQVTVSTSGYTTIAKTADNPFIPNVNGDGNGSGSWTVALRSFDPLPQAFTDTIDILPYLGDNRGTAFSGSYTIQPVSAVAGATVYYTTANAATLSDDPADVSNGAAGSVTGNTVGWTTTFTPNATAVRVIGPQLAPGAEQQFTVPITTSGAKGGDKLVNRAQARDEHTQLVMRTSAPITVANYYAASLKKYVQDVTGNWHDANAAADYPAFHYGDTIKYRIVVTNNGQGTLTNISVTDDKQPQLGAFTVASLAPGQSQTHEYSVVLDNSVSGTVVNTASATADTPPDSQTPPTIPSDPAGFDVTNYTTTKTADPAAGTPVQPGQVIHYTVTVTQQGLAPANAQFSDDLSKVLDDAKYNGDVQASLGIPTITGTTLAWAGIIPVGQVATVTYSVTVHDVAGLTKAGDADLFNPVTSPGCVTAAVCTTDHKVGWFTYNKVADPKSGTGVGVGDTVKYTITVTQHGKAAIPGASIKDNLTDVIDDATYNADARASSGTASYVQPTLTWTGDLAVAQRVTIAYTATVTGNGNSDLINPVTSDDQRGSCDPTIGCRTEHKFGAYVYSKVANPQSGSTVNAGNTITYTVTVTQRGKAAINRATVADDLSKVLDDATYNNDAKASGGAVSFVAPRLIWTGNLAIGAKVTITYSVTVTGSGDGHLANVVATPDKRGSCDTSIGCASGGLASTGDNVPLKLILAGLLLGAGGLLQLTGLLRRRRVS
jgi:uncharacterized repeat protein (TIGR01451 family)